MLWKKKLTNRQLSHLKEMNTPTLALFKSTRARQKESKAKALADGLMPGIAEPCFECREIAKRLGLE
ncbi:MAG: hypothetical protein KKB70_07410 [Proteobacteria bacterium]|nr:hypothetical protein [Pseudomonadota bacterium]